MFLKPILLFAIAGLALANGRGCGTAERTEDQLQTLHKLARKQPDGSRRLFAPQSIGKNAQNTTNGPYFTIDTYMHTVAGSPERLLNKRVLQKQFDVIVEGFAPYRIGYRLAGTTQTVNSTWSLGQDEQEMKSKLRKGSYNALNLYFVDELHDEETGNDLLGHCTMPVHVEQDSENLIKDGCVIVARSLPGGNSTRFNMGKTAIHEIGHWLNLDHTFNGGCDEGDNVWDTPAQSNETSGCPIGRDSCPDKPGKDPIHNYMDYSDDYCLDQFSPGQIEVVYKSWHEYRS